MSGPGTRGPGAGPATHQAGAVAIGGRALLIEGAPGTGKSSLALALIDRGAALIGDDGVTLETADGRVFAAPPPRTRGVIEVRGVGILAWPVVDRVPVALVLRLGAGGPRLVDRAGVVELLGLAVPCLALPARDPLLAIKAELALARYGLGAAQAPEAGADAPPSSHAGFPSPR